MTQLNLKPKNNVIIQNYAAWDLEKKNSVRKSRKENCFLLRTKALIFLNIPWPKSINMFHIVITSQKLNLLNHGIWSRGLKMKKEKNSTLQKLAPSCNSQLTDLGIFKYLLFCAGSEHCYFFPVSSLAAFKFPTMGDTPCSVEQGWYRLF